MIKTSAPHSGAPLILCIEDEDELRRDLADELRESGYDVIEAADGNQALAQLDGRRPDLILCDISMPGPDGYAVLNAVQAKGPDYASVPFVFLSALAGPREVIAGKRLGADDYLTKPIDYDLLLATVDARLRQIRRIHEERPLLSPPDPATLCERFKLTPTEARVTIALTEGKQPAQIADALQIARTTVAFHIRNIFQKTGTNRQAELVALLLRP